MFLAERYCPVCQQYQQCKFPCAEHDPHPCPEDCEVRQNFATLAGVCTGCGTVVPPESQQDNRGV